MRTPDTGPDAVTNTGADTDEPTATVRVTAQDPASVTATVADSDPGSGAGTVAHPGHGRGRCGRRKDPAETSGGRRAPVVPSPTIGKGGLPGGEATRITVRGGDMPNHLNPPHGGVLVDPMVGPERAAELKEASRDWPSWDLTSRQLCDLELLLNGGFSPLSGFMTRAEYEGVVETMRLPGGLLWPMPITLDVDEGFAEGLEPGGMVALRDPEGVMLAALHVEDVWQPDRQAEAVRVFGTDNPEHPAVDYLMHRSGPVYVGGRLEGLQLPVHYDFRTLRPTPAQLR